MPHKKDCTAPITTNSSPDWRLTADQKRQASDSLRGYNYQAWQALHAWLNLRADQVLYLEGAEDFDVNDPVSGQATQVKDTAANITLRTESVVAAISSFWHLQQSHPDKNIGFRYLTSAAIGVEKGNPFGDGRAGLECWKRAHGDETSVCAISLFLREDASVSPKLPPDLKRFLKNEGWQDIDSKLIFPILWLTNAPPATAVVDVIERLLSTHGDRYNIPPSESVRVLDTLFRTINEVAAHPDASQRQVDRACFLKIFEETTTIRVPRTSALPCLRASGARLFAVPSSLATTSQISFADVIVRNALSFRSPPVLRPGWLIRDSLVDQCKAGLRECGVTFVHGSTGTGKTTLAAQVCRSLGGAELWFHIPRITGVSQTWVLQQIELTGAIAPDVSVVVFDDLDLTPTVARDCEQVLSSIVYTLISQRTAVIVTSQRSAPQRLQSALGLPPTSQLPVPRFSEGEVRELCLASGCVSGKVADFYAKLIMAHTGGHPQLMHARVLTLSRASWPILPVETLLDTPAEVLDERMQSRQLLDALGTDSKTVLYLASIAVGDFHRPHILTLAERTGISTPGDLFDAMVGPWIEQIADDRFALSPLLATAANAAWSESKVTKAHGQMADVILATKQLSSSDVAAALMHAFRGANRYALSQIALGLLSHAPEPILQAVAKSSLWFVLVRVEPESANLFDEDTDLSVILRMLQFSMAKRALPKEALHVSMAWQREVERVDVTPTNVIMRYMCYVQTLLHVEVPCPLDHVVALFDKLVSLEALLEDSRYRELSEIIPRVYPFPDEGPREVITMMFGMNAMRCCSTEDLSVWLRSLDALDVTRRTRLLSAFYHPEGYAQIYIDRAFLGDNKKGTPDWSKCLAELQSARDYAVSWNSPALGAAAIRGMAVVLDEHLGRQADALRAVEDGLTLFPSESASLHESCGTVHFHANNLAMALDDFSTAFAQSPPMERHPLRSPVFFARDAACCAAGINDWLTSAQLFILGHDCAAKMGNPALEAGFLGDAAYAFWRSGKKRDSATCLVRAAAFLESLNRPDAALADVWAYRTVTHAINWMLITEEKGEMPPDLPEPYAGACSNPNPNPDIRNLPLFPVEAPLFFLIRLEAAVGADPEALRLYGTRLDQTKRPSLSMLMAHYRIEHAFSKVSLAELPILVDRMSVALIRAKRLKEKDSHAWDEDTSPVDEATTLDGIWNTGCLDGLFLAAVFIHCVKHTTSTLTQLLEAWRTTSVPLSWQRSLEEYLQIVDRLRRASAPMLQRTLFDTAADHRERYLAALFLALDPEVARDASLVQAHIFLLMYFKRLDQWGRLVEEALSSAISAAWLVACNTPALLSTPRLTMPVLQAACALSDEGFAKAAKVCLAAADSVSVRMPTELTSFLTEMATVPKHVSPTK